MSPNSFRNSVLNQTIDSIFRIALISTSIKVRHRMPTSAILFSLLAALALAIHAESKSVANTNLRFNHQRWYEVLTPSIFNISSSHDTITSIHLETNEILDIAPNAFASFPKLTHLHLNNNILINFTVQIDTLEYLDLSHNYIDDEYGVIARQHSRLLALNLGYNNLAKVNWQLGHSPLTTLDLSNNMKLHQVKITSYNLQDLSLEGLKLRRLHLDTPNLRELDLRRARFEDKITLEDVCAVNIIAHQDVRIVYLEKNESAFFVCEKRSDKVLGKGGHEVNTFTAHVKVDDVILTQAEYLRLKTSYFILYVIAIILLITNFVCLVCFYRRAAIIAG